MASADMPFLDNGSLGHGGLNDVTVEELFGEDVAINLAISTQQPSKELAQRLDSLQRRGCCQSVAWSKAGTVASITPDGRNVEFRFLRAHPDDGSWQLSEPTPCELVAGTESFPLVHLTWAGTGAPEIAVFDSAGRVTILAFSLTLNRPFLVRKWDADPIDDLNAVVGCYWLSLMPQGRQYNVLHGPATREQNRDGTSRFKYDSSFMHNFGPFHPNPSKSALLCVTTNGLLRLYWTQNTGRMEETPLELENISISDDLLTHASICSDRSELQAVPSMGCRLRASNCWVVSFHLLDIGHSIKAASSSAVEYRLGTAAGGETDSPEYTATDPGAHYTPPGLD
jgi:mediator of RNA polymerase II transcription subunit 16, fungi type